MREKDLFDTIRSLLMNMYPADEDRVSIIILLTDEDLEDVRLDAGFVNLFAPDAAEHDDLMFYYNHMFLNNMQLVRFVRKANHVHFYLSFQGTVYAYTFYRSTV